MVAAISQHIAAMEESAPGGRARIDGVPYALLSNEEKRAAMAEMSAHGYDALPEEASFLLERLGGGGFFEDDDVVELWIDVLFFLLVFGALCALSGRSGRSGAQSARAARVLRVLRMRVVPVEVILIAMSFWGNPRIAEVLTSTHALFRALKTCSARRACCPRCVRCARRARWAHSAPACSGRSGGVSEYIAHAAPSSPESR